MLCFPQMENIFDFSGTRIPSLVIENPKFFRDFMLDLYGQAAGEEGSLVLSENGKQLEISTWVEIVDNCLHFEINTKMLLGRLQSALERTAVGETFYSKTAAILQSVEEYVDSLSFGFSCDLVCRKCTPAALIKAVSVHVRDEYEDPLERLTDYMELVREFDRDKLFVLLNLRSYFTDAQISAFLKTISSNRYHALLIDCVDRPKLAEESRITVDIDLCEF